MASLKELKGRINSVKSTQKITKAKQMVAAAKLRKAQAGAEAARPYSARMAEVMASLAGKVAGMSSAPKLLAGTGKDQIHLLYQPVVETKTNKVVAFESLMRWEHPDLGSVSPTIFIPIAEETGLILDLTLFALERTARELAAWQRAIDVTPPIFASVNVSSRQLLRHELLHDVKGVITRSGVSRGSLRAAASVSMPTGPPS